MSARRLIRRAEVQKRLGVGKTKLFQLLNRKLIPPPVDHIAGLGLPTGRVLYWDSDVVDECVAAIAASKLDQLRVLADSCWLNSMYTPNPPIRNKRSKAAAPSSLTKECE